MKRRTTTVEKIRTVTRIMAGSSMRCEQKNGRLRTWAANQIRGERARRRNYLGDVRGLASVGMSGLRRG